MVKAFGIYGLSNLHSRYIRLFPCVHCTRISREKFSYTTILLKKDVLFVNFMIWKARLIHKVVPLQRLFNYFIRLRVRNLLLYEACSFLFRMSLEKAAQAFLSLMDGKEDCFSEDWLCFFYYSNGVCYRVSVALFLWGGSGGGRQNRFPVPTSSNPFPVYCSFF